MQAQKSGYLTNYIIASEAHVKYCENKTNAFTYTRLGDEQRMEFSPLSYHTK